MTSVTGYFTDNSTDYMYGETFYGLFYFEVRFLLATFDFYWIVIYKYTTQNLIRTTYDVCKFGGRKKSLPNGCQKH
jgi:hypothetical protein